MIFSLTMLPPVAVSLFFNESSWLPFVEGFVLTLLSGLLIWVPVRRRRRELRLRDGFLVVASFWFVLGTFGAAPLYFSPVPAMSLTEAIFESISGLTTTGATVLTGLDNLPKAILWYRQQLQWLGGMGIIVLVVAILPMLGVGGMQLYRAEAPGPIKDTKLTPRITETAKALWYLYVGLTVLCAAGYWFAGMTLFDAICHSFSTLSTGGYSTHDLSMGYFNSSAVTLLASFFMFLGGINFSLHFLAWRRLNAGVYTKDPEWKGYFFILFGLTIVVVTLLLSSDTFADPRQAFEHGLFQVISITTSTGFGTTNFAAWPGVLPVVLIFASFVGGCGGSTAGGMKVIRWLLVYKQGSREIMRLIHPSAEIPVKLGKTAVPARVIDAVWGFFAVYIIVFGTLMLAIMATGLDQVTAFSAIAATLNNLGPGLGEVASGFMTVSDAGKWIAISAMLLGRLEIFTLLVLITPAFWRP